MPTKAQILSQQISELFLSDYRELIAHYSMSDVFESVNAFLKMNYSDSELQAATITPGVYRKRLALALITVLNRDALKPIVADFTEAGEKELTKLRRETGLDLD